MGAFDIAVIVVVSAAFVAVAATEVYKKIKHKGGGCSCGCEGCPHACACRADAKRKK